jgi:nitrogen PTS system EIIA component
MTIGWRETFVRVGFEKAIVSALDARDKPTAIRSMVRIMLERHGFSRIEIESLSRGMLGREEIGSTGIGEGVAIPHTRGPNLPECYLGWFLAEPPIDFEALDGEPVDVFICLISPVNKPMDHVRFLDDIIRSIKYPELMRILRSGVEHFQEFLLALNQCGGVWVVGTWPGTNAHYEALAAENELSQIGAGVQQLGLEVTKLRLVAGEAQWAGCQAEIARVEAALDQLHGRLAGLGTAAAEEGRSRLAEQRRRLKEVVDRAKEGWLWGAIKEVTESKLDLLAVSVNGRNVSIRAETECVAERVQLERAIASLAGLVGYDADILIAPGAESLKRTIGETLRKRLKSLTIHIDGQHISIGAKASHFWERRSIRRTIESLQCLAGYKIDVRIE